MRFTGIEPDEFANSADFHFDSTAAVEGDFNHAVAAGRTRACRTAFVVNGMQPKRVNRLRSERAAQQFQADGAAFTLFAAPNDSIAGTHFGERNTTRWAEKFVLHVAICNGAVPTAKGGIDVHAQDALRSATQGID